MSNTQLCVTANQHMDDLSKKVSYRAIRFSTLLSQKYQHMVVLSDINIWLLFE